MNTKLITLLVLLALLISGVYALTYWRNVSPEAVPVSQEMPSGNSGKNFSPEIIVNDALAGSPVAVEISGFQFQPKELRIPVGTKVIWKNNDSVKHTVTSNTGAFGSQLFGKDETFEFTFNQTGTFAYYCKPHPNMKATIIVE